MLFNWLKAHWRPAAVALALVLAFACGRFSKPAKVVTAKAETTQTKTADTQAKVAAKSEDKTQERIVYRDRTVIIRKDGTQIHRDVERTEVDHGDKKTAQVAQVTSHVSETLHTSTETKTVTNDAPRLHVNVLAGVDIMDLGHKQLLGPIQLGGQVEYRVAGPLWLGVFGLSSGVAGVSVGIAF